MNNYPISTNLSPDWSNSIAWKGDRCASIQIFMPQEQCDRFSLKQKEYLL